MTLKLECFVHNPQKATSILGLGPGPREEDEKTLNVLGFPGVPFNANWFTDGLTLLTVGYDDEHRFFVPAPEGRVEGSLVVLYGATVETLRINGLAVAADRIIHNFAAAGSEGRNLMILVMTDEILTAV